MLRRAYFRKRQWEVSGDWEAEPVRVASAGAIWVEQAYEGRVIPVLALDTSSRPDIAELIGIHQRSPAGDVSAAWGKDPDGTFVSLYLRFERPVRATVILTFPLGVYGLVVDHMIDMRGFYIQAAVGSAPISEHRDVPRVLV